MVGSTSEVSRSRPHDLQVPFTARRLCTRGAEKPTALLTAAAPTAGAAEAADTAGAEPPLQEMRPLVSALECSAVAF